MKKNSRNEGLGGGSTGGQRTSGRDGGASHRTARVEKEILQVVGAYLVNGFRGELPGLVSVTRVIVSKDLRTAKILITVMGGADDKAVRKGTITELQAHAHEVQGVVNQKLHLKFVPRITFIYDEGFDNALRIDGILRNLEQERLAKEAAQAGTAARNASDTESGDDAAGDDQDDHEDS